MKSAVGQCAAVLVGVHTVRRDHDWKLLRDGEVIPVQYHRFAAVLHVVYPESGPR